MGLLIKLEWNKILLLKDLVKNMQQKEGIYYSVKDNKLNYPEYRKENLY